VQFYADKDDIAIIVVVGKTNEITWVAPGARISLLNLVIMSNHGKIIDILCGTVSPITKKLNCVNFDVDFEACPLVGKFGANHIFEQVSNSVELHNISRLAFQPKLVKLYEQITVKMMEVI